MLVDPRGMGKTSPKGESIRNPSPFGPDWKDAYIAPGDRSPAFRAACGRSFEHARRARRRIGRSETHGFHVVGVGAAGPVVLHAALLDDHGVIKQVTLSGP